MMMPTLGAVIHKAPWWAKIGAKVVLARLPVTYRIWKRLGVFQHGAMEQPAYAFNVFKTHYDCAASTKEMSDFVALELGPGDSLFSAMMARAYGAAAVYLVDSGPYAHTDTKCYRAMATFLEARGLKSPDHWEMECLEDMLVSCRATYMTSGLSSLHTIPDESVDFIWSHAVLEEVKHVEFHRVLKELRRIIKPNGISSHWVDLEDNISGALNHLRFSEAVWESKLMSTSGFYTNRIRYSIMMQLFVEAGFTPEVITLKRWVRLPTPRSKLSDHFRYLPQDELSVRCFHVRLRPASATTGSFKRELGEVPSTLRGA